MATQKEQHTVRFDPDVHQGMRDAAEQAGRGGKYAFGGYVADLVLEAARRQLLPVPAPAPPPSGRPGRQNLGPRVAQTVRFLPREDATVQRAAREAGYRTFSAYVNDLARAALRPSVAPPNRQDPPPLGPLTAESPLALSA